MNKIEEIVRYYLLNEATWNYHTTADEIEGYGEPYSSESRVMMLGNRDTGHFGSGTYFSTYKKNKYSRNDIMIDDDSYKFNKNQTFIKIDNHIYRVDIDIYKNLYRVHSESEGDVLYKALTYLNFMFNNIKFEKELKEEFNKKYNFVYNACQFLKLNCPSYNELMEFIKIQHKNDGKDVRSFSTIFMESNGYNGVNVSGIDKYDNTLHGSVIYNLSKI